ncbi:hypothetical protein ABZ379_28120 [Streptomyces canus]|uniref:hypothetical protein n=1 Tax=Streptomyces canus TaxID=58343 RepID=UPI0034068550
MTVDTQADTCEQAVTALRGGEFCPRGSGEVFPEQMSFPAIHDPSSLLAPWWATYSAVDEDADRRLAVTAPFRQTWHSLAPNWKTATNVDQLAAAFA